MKKREINRTVQGRRTKDGAGVSLVRVLGYDDVKDIDPFLMLDSFDSTDPRDYTAGFPMHPHRGIETVTYLISGEIEHKDSLGNKGVIHSGESQWMTAGSGILHEEMPKASEKMLGFQLWLNLPQSEKMTEPNYLGITKDMITTLKKDNAEINVISGSFEGTMGVVPKHISASIYDILLFKGQTIDIPTKNDENVFVFLIDGDAEINDKKFLSKTAIIFDNGDFISIKNSEEKDVRFIFFSAKPLNESISWGGPIVMNTEEELERAFVELRKGTFIKHK